MRIDIVTLFPDMFPGPLGSGVVGRALERGTVEVTAHNLRDYAGDRHRQVDDIPYGGGPGMVLKPEPVFKAVRVLRGDDPPAAAPCGQLTPQGRRLDHALSVELAAHPRLILVAGRYEGFDERIRTGLADREVSIGDYILSGGELAAMVLVEVVARHVPGVLGDEDSASDDSFSSGLLEHPQYTRPPEFEGATVPEVLLSGNHELIRKWRHEMALERTRTRRPELLDGVGSQPGPAGKPASKEKSR
ncbi:MAG: tRNA (guanine37-N1)-methyltransferase [Chloroflexota bacterium]|nr:tRNA (guanine37-N1)-methyltransferase [Chloroflexota bacterium]